MHLQNPTDSDLYKILDEAKTIAVVGASGDTSRTSNRIMHHMQLCGYKCIPVNPNEKEILGEKCYPSLKDIPVKIDIVNVFRRAETVLPIAHEAVEIGAGVFWLQQGIVNEEAATVAKQGNITPVMDACIAVYHSILKVPKK